MAELLRDEDSTDKHLDLTRRHQRRCRKTNGADAFAEAIEPPRLALVRALAASVAAENTEEDASDDLELAGRDGADALRNLSAAAKEYDRKSPGENTHEAIMGSGFSDDLHSDGTVESATLERYAVKVKALGETHALAGRVVELTGAAAAIRAADAAAKAAIEARAMTDAGEEIAQAAVRRAYEANSLDARKKFGRDGAERLFPRVRRKKRSSTTPPTPPVPA